MNHRTHMYTHGRIKKPRAPGPGHVEGPPPPSAEKNVCARKTRTHAHAHTNTTNVLDFTVELDTLAIVLGK